MTSLPIFCTHFCTNGSLLKASTIARRAFNFSVSTTLVTVSSSSRRSRAAKCTAKSCPAAFVSASRSVFTTASETRLAAAGASNTCRSSNSSTALPAATSRASPVSSVLHSSSRQLSRSAEGCMSAGNGSFPSPLVCSFLTGAGLSPFVFPGGHRREIRFRHGRDVFSRPRNVRRHRRRGRRRVSRRSRSLGF